MEGRVSWKGWDVREVTSTGLRSIANKIKCSETTTIYNNNQSYSRGPWILFIRIILSPTTIIIRHLVVTPNSKLSLGVSCKQCHSILMPLTSPPACYHLSRHFALTRGCRRPLYGISPRLTSPPSCKDSESITSRFTETSGSRQANN